LWAYLHRGKPRCHREVYLFATRSFPLHSLLAQPSLRAAGLPCGPKAILALCAVPAVAHPLALRTLAASPRVSFPPSLPEGSFRGADDGRSAERRPATPARLHPAGAAIPAGRRLPLRADGHPCSVRLSCRSVALLHSAPLPPRRGCRSLHPYPRTASAERTTEGGRNERPRPRKLPPCLALLCVASHWERPDARRGQGNASGRSRDGETGDALWLSKCEGQGYNGWYCRRARLGLVASQGGV
jgi:hypothetical protein